MTDLPPVVARMWGRDTAARFGPRPSQDAAGIVDAAIRIADRDGLEKVTMSRLAADVGVATMSLYRYVGSKDELLLLMADAAAPEPPDPGGRAWRAYLTDWTRSTRDYLLARPWLLTLAQSAPPTGPRTLRWLDRALGALDGTGIGYGERINIATTLSGYASQQARLAHTMSGATAPAAGLADYARILGEVLDPDGYPALSDAVERDAFGFNADWIDDADFTFGLTLLLDGIQRLIDPR